MTTEAEFQVAVINMVGQGKYAMALSMLNARITAKAIQAIAQDIEGKEQR